MKKEHKYIFSIKINGIGKTPDEAWNDAVSSFMLDPGSCPEKEEYEVEEVE